MIRDKLDAENFSGDILLVDSKHGFEAALAREAFDLILSDYNLPDYDGMTALTHALLTQPDVPVILISGTVGEEEAIKCLQIGATDYLLKDRLDRLVPAAQRALLDAETRLTRKRADAALSVSAARRAAVLDSVLDCIVTMDADGRVIEFNIAASRTFGYTKAEAMGRLLAELIIPPRFRERHNAGLARYVTTGEGPIIGKVIEIIAMRSDGTELPVELAVTAIRSGTTSIFTGVLRDITERKQAADAVLRSQKHLRDLIDGLGPSIFVGLMTPAGIMLEINQAPLLATGLTMDDVVGKPFVDTAWWSYSPAIQQQLRDAIARGAHGEASRFDLRAHGAGTQVLDVDFSLQPLRDATGQVAFLIPSANDITERKAAEVVSSRLAAIVESSDDSIIGTDLAGLITSWNRAAERVFGFSAGEKLGKSITQLIPADREDEERQIIAQITRGERVKHFETRRRTKDGSEIDVSLTVSPIEDATGAVIGMSKVARDITERKRAEEIVRLASGPVAARRRSHVAAGELAALVVATVVVYLLAARFNWFEAATRWVLTHELEKLDEAIFATLFLVLGLSVFTLRRWREAELQLTQRQQAQAALALLHDELDRRVKQRTDELADANQALRTQVAEREQAEERTRFALESAKVGIWDMDYTTGALQWSDTMAAQYGVAPGMFEGNFEGFVNRIHPDDRAATLETVGKAMASGSDFSVLNRTILPDGKVRWLNGTGRVILDGRGAPLRGIGISQDITERRSLEEQYQQAQKMEAVGQLAAGVAHDFNNLLTVILGFCELLMADLDRADPHQADVAEIQKAGVLAAGLTRQLLTFSRKEIIQPTQLDLNVIVADMRVLLERLIGENVEIVVALGHPLAVVKADRGQVEQIIMNLAVNARDAMPKGGTLRIETANAGADECRDKAHFTGTPGPCVALTMTDTGTGMTPEVRARLFEPFFTTKGVGKGTGLGLATVHGIVAQNGGSIAVASEVGKGTSFTVYLPHADAADPVVVAPPPVAPAPARSQTVLVVEDATGLREVTRRMLERSGYVVLVAANAEEALQLFDQHPDIDLLLTDVVMPGASGPELVKQLVERRPTLNVVYMSGYTDAAIVHHGILDPGVMFLQKPFSSESLGRKIREALDERTRRPSEISG